MDASDLDRQFVQAVERDEWKDALVALSLGADPNTRLHRGGCSLHRAIAANQLGVAHAFLHKGAKPDTLAPILMDEGTTPMHVAAGDGNVGAMELLRQYGALLDACDDHNETALFAAAGADQVEAVNWLLDHGANINAVSSSGSTALHATLGYNAIAAARVLIERGINCDALNKRGESAFDVAREREGNRSYLTALWPLAKRSKTSSSRGRST